MDATHQLLEYGERLAGDIPGARLVRIEDARHFVMIDRPDEVYAQRSDFLGARTAGFLDIDPGDVAGR